MDTDKKPYIQVHSHPGNHEGTIYRDTVRDEYTLDLKDTDGIVSYRLENCIAYILGTSDVNGKEYMLLPVK